MALIFSSGLKDNKFTMALPRAVREAAGISYTLSQRTAPKLEKINRKSLDEATNMRSTKSSSEVVMAVTPLPPRFCERYPSTDKRLT